MVPIYGELLFLHDLCFLYTVKDTGILRRPHRSFYIPDIRPCWWCDPLFGTLYGKISYKTQKQMGKQTAAYVCSDGIICVNKDYMLNSKQWAYVLAHCYLHFAFGHFDSDKIPGYESQDSQGHTIRRNSFDAFLWNEACDIYISRFLEDIKFGEPLYNATSQMPGGLSDEQSIYDYLLMENASKEEQLYGTAAPNQLDMHGLEKTII